MNFSGGGHNFWRCYRAIPMKVHGESKHAAQSVSKFWEIVPETKNIPTSWKIDAEISIIVFCKQMTIAKNSNDVGQF